MRSVKWIVGVVISISIFIVMLITAVDWTVCHNETYFQKEFEKYNVEENTNADMTSLMYVADEMMKYLQGERDDLILPVTIRGEVTEFFSERAKEHMVDVRNLFLMGITIRRVCMILILLGFLYLVLSKQQCGKIVSKCFNIVSIVIAVISIILSVLISMNFRRHLPRSTIFFRNDLWLLEEEDTLVNLVPEGFFMDTAFRIGLIFIGMFVACLSLSILYNLMFVKKNFQRKESDAEKIITGYKTEKEEFLVALEEGNMNWESFRKEEIVREKAYKKLRQGKKYDELYVQEEAETTETEPKETKSIETEPNKTEPKEPETEKTELIEVEQTEIEPNKTSERIDWKKEEPEEPEEMTKSLEQEEIKEAVEPVESEKEEIEGAMASIEGKVAEEPEEKVTESIEPEKEEEKEEPEEVTEPIEAEEVTEEIEEVEEPVELEEEIEEVTEPVELEEVTEEIAEPVELEEENVTVESEEPEELKKTEVSEEMEIINLDEPELEIIHVDDDEMEVVEDSRLAIKGIELEKARLESEKLHRQYGMPYEELSEEEEKSLQERMQQLMDEYNVIQP